MRLGTRRSALALAQAAFVAERLDAAGHGPCEIVEIVTRGDRRPQRVAAGAAAAADKSRWVAELEQALDAGDVDLAVHSAKDVPGETAPGLELLGTPVRAGAEDVLCGAGGLDQLAPGARVGTSSIRRMAQLRAAREDLDVVALHGNVDTRLAKLAGRENALRAIVLARAGMQRLGREAEIGGVLDPARFVPAPGQGAIALQGRGEDERARAAAAAVSDAGAFTCLRAERALAAALQASCNTPLGAAAASDGPDRLALRAWVGLPDGSAWISDELDGDAAEPELLGRLVAERLRAAGAGEMLRRAEEMASDGRA